MPCQVGSGDLSIPFCASWDNNDMGTCTTAEDIAPGTTSQCQCGLELSVKGQCLVSCGGWQNNAPRLLHHDSTPISCFTYLYAVYRLRVEPPAFTAAGSSETTSETLRWRSAESEEGFPPARRRDPLNGRVQHSTTTLCSISARRKKHAAEFLAH